MGTPGILAITPRIMVPVLYGFCALFLRAQEGDRPGELQTLLPLRWQLPPSPALSPEQEQDTFRLADGFAIELAAAEPAVQDPVALAFDQHGRMWVVEMRGFMPDEEGRGEDLPNGRISVLEDADGDGRFEKAQVYLEGLVLPRALALVQDGVLVVHAGKLWITRDTNGDLKADESTVVDAAYVETGNVEHQPNGLLRGVDNWLYSAKSQHRYRFLDGVWVKQKTEFRGQWGITQDNTGRLFYNYNYSQLHGDVVPPNGMGRNPYHPSTAGINLLVATNQTIFPIRIDTGVNRAYRPGILDDHGRLKQFASACAPCAYRGDQFPAEFQGDVFVCDPAAHIIKRNVLAVAPFNLTSRPAYPDTEFLASSDERFRPVNLYNGPDGALYVVDMYRGIIQHKQYMTSHLKAEVLKRGLQSPIHLGRIWRVRAAGRPMLNPMVSLGSRAAKDWVPMLNHPNGFWRDTAQRLLADRNDPATVPDLETMALRHANPRARFHALWTLEGMSVMNPAALIASLDDTDPMVLAAAMRVLTARVHAGTPSFSRLQHRLESLATHTNLEVLLHAGLSLGALPGLEPLRSMADVLDRAGHHLIIRHAIYSGLQDREFALVERLLEDTQWTSRSLEREVVLTELAGAIMQYPEPNRIQPLLMLAAREQADSDWKLVAVQAGILDGARSREAAPIALSERPALFDRWIGLRTAQGSNNATRLASALTWPGHQPAVPRRTESVPLTDTQKLRFNIGRELFLSVCAACHGPAGEGLSPVAPPLARSAWVLGPEQRLVRILLHGLEGPIHVNGIRYEPPLCLPSMPSLETMTDDQIASVLTYIRRSWNHEAAPIEPERVSAIRKATAGRSVPWTESDLLREDAPLTPHRAVSGDNPINP